MPSPVRESPYGKRLKSTFTRFLPHDEIYDASYYAVVIEPAAAASAEVIAGSIMADFGPRSVFDVGCGTGALLEALSIRGCQVEGLEYSEAALDYCRRRGLTVHKFDLEQDTPSPWANRRWDTAVCMEVAEHLPSATADRFIALLTQLSDAIVFTAAGEGQGGTDHVNEQPADYWVEKFRDRLFVLDDRLTLRWQLLWEASEIVPKFYWENLMVFGRIGV